MSKKREWKKVRDFEEILLEEFNGIAKITINRPRYRNAFTPKTTLEMSQAFAWCREAQQISVVLLTGAGDKAFCAGGDMNVKGRGGYVDEDGVPRLSVLDVQMQIRRLPKPVIAMVNGYAIGGGHVLHLVCDLTIASDNAIFGQPEAGLGITPGFGGTQRLARIIAPGLAKEIIYSTKNIDAAKAKEVGLVNEVYTQDELLPAAEKLANKIAKNAPIAVRACKKAINEGLDLPMDEAIVLEEKLFGSCFKTHDQIEGMDAFLTKRKEKNFINA